MWRARKPVKPPQVKVTARFFLDCLVAILCRRERCKNILKVHLLCIKHTQWACPGNGLPEALDIKERPGHL